MTQGLVSDEFPIIPIVIDVNSIKRQFGAVLDTGFDGGVIVPADFAAQAGTPDGYMMFTLADGSQAGGVAFVGTVTIDNVGSFPSEIVALGDECLVGRGLSDRFLITLDHDRRLTVEL